MIQATNNAAVSFNRPPTAGLPFYANPPTPYVGNWRAGPAAAPAAAPPAAARPAADPARTQEAALLAADVYNDTPNPPAGFRVAGQGDLDRLGLTPDMLERPGESSFRARVYVTGEGDSTRYVVSFRGTQTGEDWRNNGGQALGFNSPSYAKALAIGQRLARSDADVSLTGHSLGGGLASAAAVASGSAATTFNAAGLAPATIARAEGIARANGRGAADVTAWSVRGEVLTSLQNGGDRAIGGALGTLLGPLGGIGGAAITDAPEAYGSRHVLPDARPEGAGFWDGLNPVARHGMDWVLAGVAAMAPVDGGGATAPR